MGRQSWVRATEAKLQALQECLPALEHRFRPEDLGGLPESVRRYLAHAIPEGQLLPSLVVLEQRGEMRLPGGWRRFSARSHVRRNPPGFVWDARVDMLPLVSAWVRDGYVSGQGCMDAALAGLIPLISAPPSAEVTAAALQRYLAEGPWAPASLLPLAGVAWTPVDDSTARATLADGATQVSVDFHFRAGGEIDQVVADRYRSVDGRQVLTRWIGRFSDYREFAGMRIPGRGVVGWAPGNAWDPYWRGQILSVATGGSDRHDGAAPSARVVSPGPGSGGRVV